MAVPPIELAPPLRVSPFIRACRYGALFTGVVYGTLRFKYLKRKETKIRDYNQKQKAILNAKLEEENKAATRKEMLYLAEQCNVTPPPGF
ncbi:ATP synthase subunit e, mitochondrial [Parasteatoda tepidariorum]|uniref:ATP synthase subunit e, mitochondrial n=1 Tax=Parasteatoda tepidariorum TaxID=114398 RepID=UPI00077FD12E|nr:ATP synthase subunit e, mitochondrial [Parasteatoda tepidariorum]